jgi:hypothetical protein
MTHFNNLTPAEADYVARIMAALTKKDEAND